MWTVRKKFAEVLFAGYVLLGLLWLLLTESSLPPAAADPGQFERAHVLSWVGFIVVSALIGYGLARKARADQFRLQDRLAKIASSSPSVIFSLRMRPEGTFSFPYASPAIEEIFGVPPDALRSDASFITTMFPSADAEQLKSTLRASADRMSPWRTTLRVRHPRKSEIWIEGSAMPVRESDGSVLWHGVITDVTARMAAEQSLRESETRYRTLFNAGRDAILLFPIDERGLPLRDPHKFHDSSPQQAAFMR
ncbi:MAG: PAS domain-containing protein, partial [Gammaproteobacteria bacterium]